MADVRISRTVLRTTFDIAVSLTVMLAAISVTWSIFHPKEPKSESPPAAIPVPKDPVAMNPTTLKGSRMAPIGIVAFSDFECPYCGRFARETWPELEARYVRTGLVQFAFRHFPLAIHARALSAATAADCAAQQGKFWELHDRLFADPSALLESSIRRDGASIGLDSGKFSKCLTETSANVASDLTEARKLGLSGTPTFFLGQVTSRGELAVTTVLRGARQISVFQSALDALIANRSSRQ